MRAMTARLWLMNSTEVEYSPRSRAIRSRTSASTVASRPVVGSSRISKCRVDRDRHGDGDPLLHPAGQLMGIAVHHLAGVGDLDAAEDGGRLAQGIGRAGALQAKDLGHLLADADRRIEGAPGILIDHRDGIGPELAQLGIAQREEVAAVDRNIAGGDLAVARQIAHGGERGGGFAAARFSHQPIGLAAPDAEAEAPQHPAIAPAHAIADVEIAEGERVGGGAGRREGRAHVSSAPWMPSASRLTPTTREAMATASNSTVHQ